MAAETSKPFVEEVNLGFDSLPKLRARRNIAINRVITLSDTLTMLEGSHNLSPLQHDTIINGIQQEAKRIGEINQGIDDYEIAEGLGYRMEGIPENPKEGDHSFGIVEGQIEGRKIRLKGSYWYGNNLGNWIDDCEGELDGQNLTRDQAESIWERYEWILNDRYRQVKSPDYNVPEFTIPTPVIGSVSPERADTEVDVLFQTYYEANATEENERDVLDTYAQFVKDVSQIPGMKGLIIQNYNERKRIITYITEYYVPPVSESARIFFDLQERAEEELFKYLQDHDKSVGVYISTHEPDESIQYHLELQKEVEAERAKWERGETNWLVSQVPFMEFGIKFTS